jgi:hypothetical protein
MNRSIFLPLIFVFLFGCTGENRQGDAAVQCTGCHSMELDKNHLQPCTSCHKGKSPAENKDGAHLNYVPFPSHPDHLQETCGPCHSEITTQITRSNHFTLHNSVNQFRKSFSATEEISSFLDTPAIDVPETSLELADDLLRRRCFRCHPYNQGDNYPSVTHGTGCAACHLFFSEGKAVSHSFQAPGDDQCLSCHYGNYVGFDYYGRFENDLNVEYRTPYTTTSKYFRPYGVEYHQLIPDIHQSRGMVCIDCHSGRELMLPGSDKISCKGCHLLEELLDSPPPQIEKRQGLFVLHSRDQREHIVPLLQHPAHFEQTEKIACQACHAQWTFNDFGKHFLRSDTDEFEEWANLSIQGSFEIETILENNNDFDKTELPPQMRDKITGEQHPGLWYKGFSMRRWETVLLGRDETGTISPVRPILDVSLSWIDEEENVRFDDVHSLAPNNGLRSYVPHTTGPAGIFYKERIEHFLKKERAGIKK